MELVWAVRELGAEEGALAEEEALELVSVGISQSCHICSL